MFAAAALRGFACILLRLGESAVAGFLELGAQGRALFAVEGSSGFEEEAEEYCWGFISEACLDDEAAELNFAAGV
jgi:hypothetical protein